MAAQIIESLSSGNVLEVKNNDTVVFSVDTTSAITLTSKTGWGTPTGTLARTTFASYAGQNVSAAYVEAEAQATDDALVLVSHRLAALITDLISIGIIKA